MAAARAHSTYAAIAMFQLFSTQLASIIPMLTSSSKNSRMNPAAIFFTSFRPPKLPLSGELADDPQRVVLKMSSYQAKFIRALPLHHTQREEVTTEEYSIFSYYLCPHTYDFKQAILMLMAEAEVLEPQSLRNKIADIVHAIDKKYWQIIENTCRV